MAAKTVAGRKAKGRRLQVYVAESLAQHCGLTIEATPPTKPGRRANGVRYVSESDQPDLRVRQSSQPGADVVLVSVRAREVVALRGMPFWIECKNQEAFRLEAAVKARRCALAEQALHQASAAWRAVYPYGAFCVAVLGRNRQVPLVAIDWEPDILPPIWLRFEFVWMTRWDDFIKALLSPGDPV